MNKFCIALSLGLGSRLVSAEPVQPIIHAPLDAKTVFRLPVASDRITTVYFPGPISGLEAAFVTLDGEPPARFQCSFLPGQRYFSLRAIQPVEVDTCVDREYWTKRPVPARQIRITLQSRSPRLSVAGAERNGAKIPIY